MNKVDEFIEKLRSLTYSYESRFRMEEAVSELLSTLNTYDMKADDKEEDVVLRLINALENSGGKGVYISKGEAQQAITLLRKLSKPSAEVEEVVELLESGREFVCGRLFLDGNQTYDYEQRCSKAIALLRKLGKPALPKVLPFLGKDIRDNFKSE
jgi:uncharacterized protein YegP (UPF0339 family)